MKTKLILLTLASAVLSLTGCAGISPTQSIVDAGAGVGAGGVTYAITKNPYIAAGAGVVGVVGADLAQQVGKNKDKKVQEAAYQQGKADCTKQLYWAKVESQKTTSTTTASAAPVTLYPITNPASTSAGVNYVSSTMYIPVPDDVTK